MVRKISVVSMRGTPYLMYLVGLMASIGVGRVTAAFPTAKEGRAMEVLDAAKVGNYSRAHNVLRQPGDIDVNIKDQQNGNTILHYAATAGHVDIVKTLIEKKVNENIKNNEGKTPHDVAVKNGKAEVVKLLAEYAAGKARAALLATRGKAPIIRSSEQCKKGSIWHECQFFEYAKNGDLDGLAYMVDKTGLQVGLATAETNGTILHLAAAGGHVNVAMYAIDRGVSVHAKDDNGWQPIHHALKAGHSNMIRLLIENGVNVNTGRLPDGATALHIAAAKGQFDMVKFLVANKANVNIMGSNGWTPLHNAAINGHLEIVKFLVENGAGVNSVIDAPDCRTPLSLANKEVADYLRTKGAKVGSAARTEVNPFDKSQRSYCPKN